MKYYYKIILSLTILSFMSVGWGQECYNVGNDEEFDGASSHGPNCLLGQMFTLEKNSYIDYLNVIGKAAGPNFQLALYSDDGTRDAANLIVYTNIYSLNVGINQIPVESTYLSAGDYWIMGIFETSASIGIRFGDGNWFK